MESFLQFKPVEFPSWRKRKEYSNVPKISQMLHDITEYHKLWQSVEKENSSTKHKLSQLKRKMALEFFLRLQESEDIGVKDKETFGKLFDDVKKSENPKPPKRRKRSLSGNEDADDRKRRRNETDHSLQDNSKDSENIESLPTSLELHDYLVDNSEDPDIDTNIKESTNLLKAYWHLRKELKKLSAAEKQVYAGEIDIEMCVQECHKILMKDIMDEGKTKPGTFSTLPRSVYYDDETFFYPSYATEDIAYDAVDTLIIHYNFMVEKITKSREQTERVEMTLKCATLLLFGFLTLHPFADGNGRLARLLCSHCLSNFCPFQTAIYNVFSPSSRDDYIEALINGRKNLKLQDLAHSTSESAKEEVNKILTQGPSELCSLLIECNWFSWRFFLTNLGVETIKLYDFESVGRHT